jgi:hypothetical protein
VAESSHFGCNSCILGTEVAAGGSWPGIALGYMVRTRDPGKVLAARLFFFLLDGVLGFRVRV